MKSRGSSTVKGVIHVHKDGSWTQGVAGKGASGDGQKA
jgi:hypothetical protein